MTFSQVGIWIVCICSIVGVFVRPRGTPEWMWAVGGATILAVLRLVPLETIADAIGRGADVYLFLAGMMVLAELARRQGVFDWVATYAVRASAGSKARLFVLVYGVGIVVTVVLSNDATAVVLTPAVAAAVRAARVKPLPYLFACAFIANAASFVLPISNPANLVVFAHAMPTLPRWLSTFGVPSLLAIGLTFLALVRISFRDLRGTFDSHVVPTPLLSGGRIAIGGIALTAVSLIIASSLGVPLGATTAACALVVFAVASMREKALFRSVAGSVTWSVLALVAGLFVLVAGLEQAGFSSVARQAFVSISRLSPVEAVLGAALVSSVASNVMNNLPAGVIAGSSVAAMQGHDAFRSAVAIAIDLGPNLSVTGSLATILWLIALRREGIGIDAWAFLRAGAIVMPPALVFSVLSVLLTTC